MRAPPTRHRDLNDEGLRGVGDDLRGELGGQGEVHGQCDVHADGNGDEDGKVVHP